MQSVSHLIFLQLALLASVLAKSAVEEVLARDLRSYYDVTELKFLGIGYDIMRGCPDGNIDFSGGGGSAGADPGLKTTRKIIKWVGRQEDNGFMVPRQVTFGGYRDNCVASSVTSMLYGSKSYQNELSKSVSVEVSVSWGLGSVGFSASHGVKTANENMNGRRNIFFRESETCMLGQVRYDRQLAGADNHELEDAFIMAACQLPVGNVQANKYLYKKFLDDWGTHMTTYVQFGTKIIKLRQKTETEMFQAASKETNTGASVSGGYGPVSASVSVNVGKFESYAKENNEMGEQTAELYQGTSDNPEPTKLELLPISEVMDDTYWSASTCSSTGAKPDLAKLKDNLHTALENYPQWVNAPELSDLPMSFKIEWPTGQYSLLAAKDGECPFSDGFSFHKGYVFNLLDFGPPAMGDEMSYQYLKRRDGGYRYSYGKSYFLLYTQNMAATSIRMPGASTDSPVDQDSSLGIFGGVLTMGLHFCTKTNNAASGSGTVGWGVGQYCIMPVKGENSCPNGFSPSKLKLTTKQEQELRGFWEPKLSDTTSAFPDLVMEGLIPNADRYSNHGDIFKTIGLHLCCRNDGYFTNAILLPPNEPLVLFPVSHGCQKVSGMTDQIVKVEVGKRLSVKVEPQLGAKPEASREGSAKGYFNVCYYQRT